MCWIYREHSYFVNGVAVAFNWVVTKSEPIRKQCEVSGPFDSLAEAQAEANYRNEIAN